jgi:hypothetical protein
MPVTAKLSQKFYERLGDEIANELVNWFNAVDATYRSDLKELNELNYARFDAKVDQRFAEARVETERQIAALRVEMERGFGVLRTEIAGLRTEIEGVKGATAAQRADLLKWMFGFWVATVVPLGGLVVGLFTLLR